MEQSEKPGITPLALAQLARSWDVIEERKRILRQPKDNGTLPNGKHSKRSSYHPSVAGPSFEEPTAADTQSSSAAPSSAVDNGETRDATTKAKATREPKESLFDEAPTPPRAPGEGKG